MIFAVADAVQSIAFPPMKDVREGSLVSVCFERGGKMVTSQDRAVVSAAGPMKGDMRVEIKETLRLVATLYRKGDHTHHTYQVPYFAATTAALLAGPLCVFIFSCNPVIGENWQANCASAPERWEVEARLQGDRNRFAEPALGGRVL